MRICVQRRRRAPVRMLVLLAVCSVLGVISSGKLRSGWVGSPATLPGQEQGQRDRSMQAARSQLQAGTASNEPQVCFDKFTWVNKALDEWYAPAWQAANASLMSTEQALQALRDVMWKEYHPGMDEIVLRYRQETGGVEMEVIQIAPPNQPHKKPCILEVLRGAVARHNRELGQMLERKQQQEIRFMVVTEDFGVVWRAVKWKLPSFAMSTDEGRSDIPIPDFTYSCYPEARYSNSSWPAIMDLLVRKSELVPWKERQSALFHRSNWGVGPRKQLMPLLESYANGAAGTTAVEAFGADLDIANTGFVYVQKGEVPKKAPRFAWLDEQCGYKYLIHTAGFSYSGGLKYKLACGSIVFKFHSPFREFFEPALQDGVHVVKLPARHEGVDVERFKSYSVPRIKEVVTRTINMADIPPIGRQAKQFAVEQLSPEALQCYWLGAIQRYADIYFLPTTPAQALDQAKKRMQQAAQQRAGGDAAAVVPGGKQAGDLEAAEVLQ